MIRGLTKKGRLKAFFCFIFLLIIIMILECQLRYPDRIILFEGEPLPHGGQSAYSLNLDTPAGQTGVLADTGELTQDSYSRGPLVNQGDSYDMTLKLFGVIPVRSVTVDVKPRTELVACGNSIGIKIFTKGLVCVGTQAVRSKNGMLRDLSQEQDIRTGDIFLSVNDKKLTETEQMSDAVEQSGGQEISITVWREGRELSKKFTPIETDEGYKLGFWLRDSTAGIGTLTYYDPETLSFGALGHPITDTDTGALMPVSEGELLEATVLGVRKGEKGEPGELKGIFQTTEPAIGDIFTNTEKGVFGKLTKNLEVGQKYPIASKNNVEVGHAIILSNISGDKVESFDVEIQKNIGLFGGYKDMIIHVTDSDLLERTGGIVQGMSGSPIIQKGKLVGAVTHVFVNDPTRGYGIFIENMLPEAENKN